MYRFRRQIRVTLSAIFIDASFPIGTRIIHIALHADDPEPLRLDDRKHLYGNFKGIYSPL